MRPALGASRGSLVWRLLTETTLLSLLAWGAGIGLAEWLLNLLATVDPPLPIPVALDRPLDGRVLAFALGVSVVTGALLGLVPLCRAPGRASLTPSEARTRAVASPVSSGGATRWSSRS